jgi:DNA-binding protein WhiA
MSKKTAFADKIKSEIVASKPTQREGSKSFCYAVLLMGNRFDKERIRLITKNKPAYQMMVNYISMLLGKEVSYNAKETKSKDIIYTIDVKEKNSILRIMKEYNHSEAINYELINEFPASFMAGAFISCGSAGNMQRNYHIIFEPPSDELCDVLFKHLTTLGYPPKTSFKRGRSVLYYKESEQIEDILTMAGATNSSLELMELKIYKDLRNRANRATNCETANIDKLVKSSQKQLRCIEILKEKGILNSLAPHLIETANIRERNPDVSLNELAKLAGISRSGLYHRMAKIESMASAIEDKNKEHG